MSMNKPRKINRRGRKSGVWSVLFLLLAAVVVSLAIAVAWQVLAGEDAAQGEFESLATPSPTPTATQSPVPTPTPAPTPSLPEPVGVVPESARVESSYFDDAVFVGDSITEGMLIYGGLGQSTVLAGRGINFSTLGTKEVVEQEDGSKITIIDGLKKRQFAKVYLMLGGNEVAGDKAYFLKQYGKVIDEVRALQPDAVFYVQSMTPVTRQNNYNLANPRIDEFNEAVKALCEEKNVYYLNVAEALKDSEGFLPTEASPADGMHFGNPYFQKWFEYLKIHTVSLQMPERPANETTDNMKEQ